MAEDPNDSQPQECSPKASQCKNHLLLSVPDMTSLLSKILGMLSGIVFLGIEKTESDNEDEESVIMSQPVWNDDDPIEGCENTSQRYVIFLYEGNNFLHTSE